MLAIDRVVPSELLKRVDGELHRLIHIHLRAAESASLQEVALGAVCGGRSARQHRVVTAGESVVDIMVPEPISPSDLVVTVRADGGQEAVSRCRLTPARRWRIHVVQLSHHDAGYTNLPSQTIIEHRRWLADAIELSKSTAHYPDDAKFRIVIEQAWSVTEFFRTATSPQADELVALLKDGTFELTALFGNLTTELCGHETLVRALYPSGRIAKDYSIPIVSAEHNDIPGFTWGLSHVLTEAGVKIFCPGLPLYYSWGGEDLSSFWDEKKIFGYEGPGAFWWQAPSGKRVLFWCNNSGCGGDALTKLPGLDGALTRLAEGDYPYTSLRWPVDGARRDNSPYSAEYCDTVKTWNETWESPRLIMSTNAGFYDDLIEEIPGDLPVWEGELPGQDYPVGATSTAAATAANRRNHAILPVAEILSSAARLHTDYQYPARTIDQALEEILWHDEHAWGHHFPAGPTARASLFEKSIHAYRAETFLHDVVCKSTARIADAIRPPDDPSALRLVVFNPFPSPRTGGVRAPLREIDNCGSTIYKTIDQGTGEPVRRGVLLTDRWHITPDTEVTAGSFRLIDEESGAVVAYQIEEIDGAMDALPYAAERVGLGSGTKRYGFFEDPVGLRRDIVFLASCIPSCGYKSYLLVPHTKTVPPPADDGSAGSIENEFFRVEVSGKDQQWSIIDKRSGSEVLDESCPHGFLEILVRPPDGSLIDDTWEIGRVRKTIGPAGSSMVMEGSVSDHPAIHYRIGLINGDPEIHLSVRILKSPEPLQDVFLCFPFLGNPTKLGYEGTLCTLAPGENLLPGAYSDELTVQNWVSLHSSAGSFAWASLDAPVVCLSELWPGYTSPAHRAVLRPELSHPAATANDYNTGWIYSRLFGNNFGTNFYVSQCGDALFRYVIRAALPEGSAGMNAVGASMVTPFVTTFGATDRDGHLPTCGGALSCDDPDLVLLTWKRAESADGHVFRVWNPKPVPSDSRLTLHGYGVTTAWYAHPREVPLISEATTQDGSMLIKIAPRSFATVFVPDHGISATM
jgi:hypothetical protein